MDAPVVHVHGRTVCACGALLYECFCLDREKPVTTVPYGCPSCQAVADRAAAEAELAAARAAGITAIRAEEV